MSSSRLPNIEMKGEELEKKFTALPEDAKEKEILGENTVFERIKITPESMNQQLVAAINSLRQSYQQPKLLFESVE